MRKREEKVLRREKTMIMLNDRQLLLTGQYMNDRIKQSKKEVKSKRHNSLDFRRRKKKIVMCVKR